MPTAYIGIDDTDNHESRGTGHLARAIADQLALNHKLHGVVRHQLFFDPRVPFTSHNSSASIVFEMDKNETLDKPFNLAKQIMQGDFQPGSDPGLCISVDVPESVIRFGQTAKKDIVTQEQARVLAAQYRILLEGLGGTQDGVIGALSAVGLSYGGFDGRYVRIGNLRQLHGEQSIETVLHNGVDEVQTLDGVRIHTGIILAEKLRPARRAHKAILFVEKHEDGIWYPLKLD